mmetsp:Transcript_1146/g.2485  ORF Transcript_1146/g.2485 Transcript_1146/m.2485 type:complete len:382 (-) Transcript_1146:454-1599(-)
MVRCSCIPWSSKKQAEKIEDVPDKSAGDQANWQPLSDYLSTSELQILGQLASRVRVMLDPSMPATLHGTSRVQEGVPLAIVNPNAPDKRYVILHELMHHQLDELGCPSLCCTLQGREPPADSWLRRTQFQIFVRGLLVQLWELIQHSRFNSMIDRVFRCGPESARDGEYRGYMNRNLLPTYGMCRSDGHVSIKKVAVAAHVATVFLECSQEMRREFLEFVKSKYLDWEEMIQLGKHICSCIHPCDVEFLKLSSKELNTIMYSMLNDLKNVLDSLDLRMTIDMGKIRPLKVKFNQRCSTAVNIDFLNPSKTSSSMVSAGGFGGRFGFDARHKKEDEGVANSSSRERAIRASFATEKRSKNSVCCAETMGRSQQVILRCACCS